MKSIIFSFIIGFAYLANGAELPADDATKSQINVSIDAITSEPIADTTLLVDATTIKHDTTTSTPKTTPTPKTTTTRPTTTTPVTTSTPQTTTTPATTTTTTTTTTTAAPTTTSTTTTTPAPTPTPNPTPTPKPTPPPQPDTILWTSQCIMIKMASQLNVTYVTKNNGTAKTSINIPKEAIVTDASCDAESSQGIHISWNASTGINQYSFIFFKNDTNYYLYSIQLTIEISDDIYPDAENQTLHLFHQSAPGTYTFRTPVEMSYHCTRKDELNLTKLLNETESVGSLTISNVQLEAFHTGNSTKFSTAKDCDSSDTPDVVPIAVGVSLIVLISVILIAYLVARRRSNARGYMSF